MPGPTVDQLAAQRKAAANGLNGALSAVGQGKWHEAEQKAQDALDAIRRAAGIQAALARAKAS